MPNQQLNQNFCRYYNQCYRGERLEDTGVANSISTDELEETTIKIFDKLDVATDPSNIEDCHWLESNGPKKVIIKFARRKDANLIRKNKNKLTGMNLCSIDINNLVFITHSLCSYLRCYGENAKHFGLVNIFMFFGYTMAH